MFLYVTSGTADFMEKVVEKNTKHPIILLHGNGNSVLLHETEKKSVFAVPRKFEVLDGSGELEQKGYYVFHNIPVTDEGRLVFEEQMLALTAPLKSDSSLIAFRLLRPIKAETYILLTQWSGPASYDVWKNSTHYQKLEPLVEGSTSSVQAIFNGASYISIYIAPPKDQ